MFPIGCKITIFPYSCKIGIHGYYQLNKTVCNPHYWDMGNFKGAWWTMIPPSLLIIFSEISEKIAVHAGIAYLMLASL